MGYKTNLKALEWTLGPLDNYLAYSITIPILFYTLLIGGVFFLLLLLLLFIMYVYLLFPIVLSILLLLLLLGIGCM